MSETQTLASLDLADFPASHIIDSCGGVRPLAKKLDLAASTVQGWKLRDHIPESYHHRLKNLLQEESVDLFAEKSDDTKIITSETTPARPTSTPVARPMPPNPNAAYFAMPQSTMRYWIMSSITTLGVLALVTVILFVVFFGHDFFDYMTAEEELTTLTAPVPPAAAPVPAPSAAIQADLDQSRAAIDTTLDSVKKIKQDADPQQTELVAQIDRIETVVGSLRDRVDNLDKALQDKGVDTRTIRDQINSISQRDVMAAGLLLGVAHVHSMLDNQANFAQDLAFLKALLAHDPEMIKSLDKLAPFAEKGLMTREQMIETLDMVSRETIKVSDAQPNLTWTQKLWAALGNVIEIRKTEAIRQADISTPAGQIAQAKDYLADNEYVLAAQMLQSYQGPGADQVALVLQNLQGHDAAQDILGTLLSKSQQLLDINQLQNLFGNLPTGSTGTGDGALY